MIDPYDMKYIRAGNTIKDECEEADLYVRDHLLIQFMISHYMTIIEEPENIYTEWQRWLKKQEERHGQRSEV